MLIEGAGFRFDWIDEWSKLRLPEAWPHSAVVMLRSGDIVTSHPRGGALLVLSAEGEPVREIPVAVPEAHGITLVQDGDDERFWLADAAAWKDPAAGYSSEAMRPAVVKVDLTGSPLLALEPPPRRLYSDGPYKPTWVAVDEARFGGDGTVWVADGYGQSLVHRYTAEGGYVATITGEEGAGRFDCPHALFVDRRREPELYVTDRGNSSIQVFDLDGTFRRTFGQGDLSGPTAIAPFRDHLFVIENWPPRITVLDPDDRVVGRLAEDPRDFRREGWPNELDEGGRLRRYSGLLPGRLNSPHGIAIDADGAVYITEFVIGTRITKLNPVA